MIECSIGNTKQVKAVLAESKIPAVTTRSSKGILAFGSDADLRSVFSRYGISRFDTHSIEPKRLTYDSAELGLLRDALAVSLDRNRPVRIQRQRTADLCFIDAATASEYAEVADLKKLTGQIAGIVAKTDVKWEEAIFYKLAHHLQTMWLLIEPTVRIHLLDSTVDSARDIARNFARERMAARYNRTWNSLLDAWSSILVGHEQEITLRAFSDDDGHGALFRLHRTTGFSRRGPRIV